MTNLEQAARQALDALEKQFGPKSIAECEAITALRQALKSVEQKQEPVVYQYRTRANWEGASGWSAWENCTKGRAQDYWSCPLVHDWLYEARALYTEPSKREWVGLTDEELVSAYMNVGDKEWAIGGMRDATKFAHTIAVKLKEKNT